MGLTIDARLVSKRKYYLVLFGFTCMVTQYMIGMGQGEIDENQLVYLMIVYNFGAAFLDATIDSVSIQQARVDLEMGQKMISSFRSVFFALGAIWGTAVVIMFENPFTAF